ncbi:hypothetical protein SFUMM280S_00026 [Streptomyces fumanus]
MPSARTWALIPSWEWHRAGVDDKRAATVLRAVRVAARMEEAAAMEPAAARARLEVVPGVGPGGPRRRSCNAAMGRRTR